MWQFRRHEISDKRIAVIGTGGTGSTIAGLLTKAGHDVTIIDQWPEHGNTMND
ncbi:MAG: NAD(P)-binding protein, partial [Chloroflexi bacterium]|nr:NAD(P)-binding protein [Chloroflexota bacterium]